MSCGIDQRIFQTRSRTYGFQDLIFLFMVDGAYDHSMYHELQVRYIGVLYTEQQLRTELVFRNGRGNFTHPVQTLSGLVKSSSTEGLGPKMY